MMCVRSHGSGTLASISCREGTVYSASAEIDQSATDSWCSVTQPKETLDIGLSCDGKGQNHPLEYGNRHKQAHVLEPRAPTAMKRALTHEANSPTRGDGCSMSHTDSSCKEISDCHNILKIWSALWLMGRHSIMATQHNILRSVADHSKHQTLWKNENAPTTFPSGELLSNWKPH